MSHFKGKLSLPTNHQALALHLTPSPHSVGVSTDALLAFQFTNPKKQKAVWLSVYIWAHFLFVYASAPPLLSPPLHLCCSVRRAQPSFSEMWTMLRQSVCANMMENAWIVNNQYEIMAGSEYVFLQWEKMGEQRVLLRPVSGFQKGNITHINPVCLCARAHACVCVCVLEDSRHRSEKSCSFPVSSFFFFFSFLPCVIAASLDSEHVFSPWLQSCLCLPSCF